MFASATPFLMALFNLPSLCSTTLCSLSEPSPKEGDPLLPWVLAWVVCAINEDRTVRVWSKDGGWNSRSLCVGLNISGKQGMPPHPNGWCWGMPPAESSSVPPSPRTRPSTSARQRPASSSSPPSSTYLCPPPRCPTPHSSLGVPPPTSISNRQKWIHHDVGEWQLSGATKATASGAGIHTSLSLFWHQKDILG